MAVTYSNCTGSAWYIWCDSASATSSSYTTNNTWVSWNSSVTTSASSNEVWEGWVTSTIEAVMSKSLGVYTPESEEQRQDRLERERVQREEWQRKEEERKAKQVEANKKADELLKSLLSPEQVEQLDSLSCFIVTTPNGNVYRIKRGWSGNVEKLDQEQKPIERLCAHPSEYVPDADNMVAQLLMLQTEEDKFLRIANRTVLRPVAN